MSLNHIVAMGRITKDLEKQTTPSGVSHMTFTIAVDDDYKPKDGDRDTDFLRVKAWRHTADFLEKYSGKGRMIVVTGRLKADNYTDKDGNKRTDTYILAENVYFADSKPSNGDSNSEQQRENGFAESPEDDGQLPF